MKDKVFLDTNFLVYLQNHQEPQRQEHCRSQLTAWSARAGIVISTQVVQEFFIVMTKKMGADPVQVKNVIQLFRQFEIVLIDPDTITHAIDISVVNQLSFWDALIVSSAIKANCTTVLTEDLNSGQVIGGVRITNPFTAPI